MVYIYFLDEIMNELDNEDDRTILKDIFYFIKNKKYKPLTREHPPPNEYPIICFN